MRPVIDGHNDVLSRLQEEDADDTALLRDDSASITVPSARSGRFAGVLCAVRPPPGPLAVVRAAGG